MAKLPLCPSCPAPVAGEERESLRAQLGAKDYVRHDLISKSTVASVERKVPGAANVAYASAFCTNLLEGVPYGCREGFRRDRRERQTNCKRRWDCAMTALRALLITDRIIDSRRSTGFRWRVSSLQLWLETAGFEVVHQPVAGTPSPSMARRFVATLWSVRRLRKQAEGFDLVVLHAMNAPHMVWLAQRLKRHGAVVLDPCDSLALWAEAYSWRARPFLKFKIWLAQLLIRTSPEPITCSYVTLRDANADKRAGVAASPIVILSTYPDDLGDLEPYVGPPVRIVMPADLTAPQNLEALSWFWDAVRSGELKLGIPVEIYGPVAPDHKLSEGIVYLGWAPRLRDIYDGQTAVFAPTVSGAGIQGKYLEAVTAGRPVVVGRHAAESIPGYSGALPFASQSELVSQLNALERFAIPLKPVPVALAPESEVRRSITVVRAIASSWRKQQ